jgi:hypothetical protein
MSEKNIAQFDKTLPCDCEIRGHCMCKEMLVIPVNKVVDPKSIIGKNGWPRRRREAQGVTDPQKEWHVKNTLPNMRAK